MKDKFQILRDFANSNNKPDKTIYQFIKEVLDMNSTYAKENKQLKDNIRQMDDNIDKLQKLLIKEKDNWNNLKKQLENYWKESQDIWFVKIINKMKELEQGGKNDG